MRDSEPLRILEQLYDEHHRVAYGLAFGILHNQQDAEEALQEAFLSVWRARATFDPSRGTTRTWVLSAVSNRALGVLRVRKRQPAHEELDTERPDARCTVAATAVVATLRSNRSNLRHR